MIKKSIRAFVTILGASLGYIIASVGVEFLETSNLISKEDVSTTTLLIVFISFGLIFGLISFFIFPWLANKVMKAVKKMEIELEKIPLSQVVVGSVGLIFALIIAYLVSSLYSAIPISFVSSMLSVITFIILGYLGISISTKNMGELSKLPDVFRKTTTSTQNKTAKGHGDAKPKILDTSVIIDGRIADICKTGFVEGTIIIPEFVLEELRHIADSSDGLKRNRGRRGLDILKIIQQELDIDVSIVDNDFEDTHEVDIKLLKLAQLMDGIVVTNDFNLNKVADLQGVPVLNINELANAIKPVVLPGEEMVVTVIKEGKESNQGIAYLDDGTMIVVEGGKKFINETKHVMVTSVLQTAAGRMIFAKPMS